MESDAIIYTIMIAGVCSVCLFAKELLYKLCRGWLVKCKSVHVQPACVSPEERAQTDFPWDSPFPLSLHSLGGDIKILRYDKCF